MKCSICGKRIEELFLKKPLGTFVKDKRGKKHLVCAACQKQLGSKDEMLKRL